MARTESWRTEFKGFEKEKMRGGREPKREGCL
jgi:hypothetical protein